MTPDSIQDNGEISWALLDLRKVRAALVASMAATSRATRERDAALAEVERLKAGREVEQDMIRNILPTLAAKDALIEDLIRRVKAVRDLLAGAVSADQSHVTVESVVVALMPETPLEPPPSAVGRRRAVPGTSGPPDPADPLRFAPTEGATP